MPYYIVKTNGDELITVEDGTIDNETTDLTLLGKNYPTYGLNLNQNFIKLLENFANVDEPTSPLTGQLWYDNSSNVLRLYREGTTDNKWQSVAAITSSDIEPEENLTGDLWWDSESAQLKLYNGLSWTTIGPQTTSTGLLRVVGNNNFRIQISGTDVFSIDPDGRVTKPLNPVYQGTGYTGSVNVSTSDITTYQTWTPETVLINIGSNFTKATGIFVAPVDGLYRVHAQVMTNGSGKHNISWRVNDSDYGISASVTHTTGNQMMIAAGIIEASENDIITLVASTDGGASISYLNSSFTIELVG